MKQFNARDIGKGEWSEDLWVTKTDVVQYLRCPYKVYLAYRDNRPYNDFVESRTLRFFMEQGTRFEESAVARMPVVEVPNIEGVLQETVVARTPELIVNHELGIRGVPDLVVTERGELYPIEVKFHGKLRESDKVEIAFYWKLLEPLRLGNPTPLGYVLLRAGTLEEVILSDSDFAHLAELLQKVRAAKAGEAQPEFGPECRLCRERRQCEPLLAWMGGLTLVHGIASVRQQELKESGITSLKQFAEADASELCQLWSEVTHYPLSSSQVQAMQAHARSWLNNKPVHLEQVPLPPAESSIILDLEYVPDSHIWLSGMLIPEAKQPRLCQFFAEDKAGETQLLNDTIRVLQEYQDFSVMTWYGSGADFSQLSSAWRRLQLDQETLVNLREKHIDLYRLFFHSFRLPISSFGLKEVASA